MNLRYPTSDCFGVKRQRPRSQGHKVQNIMKAIEWPAWVMHSIECPASSSYCCHRYHHAYLTSVVCRTRGHLKTYLTQKVCRTIPCRPQYLRRGHLRTYNTVQVLRIFPSQPTVSLWVVTVAIYRSKRPMKAAALSRHFNSRFEYTAKLLYHSSLKSDLLVIKDAL